ncbi:putative MFS monocarboxylate transporter [Lasiosphaeris hirsuta]|uniref:MFS monocarboxylate transporter n=1 Tax=Lasiosphaeris hirsuta TaxID=260670 RepID=A0AA39ZRG0_9PEZI|nr:putative MFS monocarboxylate transporter [Lasiosphaeris hirsuta]
MVTTIPKPDQGGMSLHAGLAVLGGSLALFCSVGFMNAFGVFQQYYKENILQDMSESQISWIGSVSIFLVYAVAPITGILVDRIGPTALLIIGALGTLLAVFMTSLCTEYYQFFLAQAMLLGPSMALLTWPPIAVVSRLLPNNRGLALGVVVGGSSVGGVVWPVMLERLLNGSNLGFGWVMRIIGFTMLPLLAILCVTVVERPQPSESLATSTSESSEESASPLSAPLEDEKSRRVDISILKNKIFLLLALGFGFGYLGLFLPIFFISSYATARGVSTDMSFYLVSIVNAASLLGRVLPGYLADRYGHFNLCLLALVASAVTGFCWTSTTSLAGLIWWSLAYGFSSGAIIALQAACVGKIATYQTQGTAMGLFMGLVAVTTLVGAPIGGALLGKYGYTALAMFTGATLLTGAALVTMSRLLLNNRVLAVV